MALAALVELLGSALRFKLSRTDAESRGTGLFLEYCSGIVSRL